jgi:hypothetical protein
MMGSGVYRRIGFTFHCNNFAVVVGEQIVSWHDDDKTARFAAESHVEGSGGEARVLKVIGQYRAVAEEKKEVKTTTTVTKNKKPVYRT